MSGDTPRDGHEPGQDPDGSPPREFGIGPILSVIGETLLCDVDDLYEILGYLTGQSLMTHQLPTAATSVQSHLREQFPDLAEVADDKGHNLQTILAFDVSDKPTMRLMLQGYLAGIAAVTGSDKRMVQRPADPVRIPVGAGLENLGAAHRG